MKWTELRSQSLNSDSTSHWFCDLRQIAYTSEQQFLTYKMGITQLSSVGFLIPHLEKLSPLFLRFQCLRMSSFTFNTLLNP